MFLSGWLSGLRSGWIRASSRPRVRRTVGAKEALEQRVVLAEDFGDAPDTGAGTGRGNYQTLLSDNGPRHTSTGTLRMGSLLDTEADASPNAAADGDDRTNHDENGVLNPQIDFQLTWDTIPRITVSTSNSTETTATLTGWIDFNADGFFDNVNERAQVAVPNGGTSAQLVFPMVPRAYTGTTYARLRLSTDPAASNSTGLAFDGEVEDYRATIAQRTAGTVVSSIRTDTPAVADGDFFGSAIANLGDLDGDGISDLAVGAFNDDTGGANTGAVHILFMNADQTVRSEVKIASGTTGFTFLNAGVGFGRSLASMGDINGDGIPDLAVGAFKDSTGVIGAGAVYLLHLNRDGSVQGKSKIDRTTLPGLAALDYFGTSVANLGDVDGDGVKDLAVGVPGLDYRGTDRGGVYILLLNANGSIKQNIIPASGVAGGPDLNDGDRFGYSLASLGNLVSFDDGYKTALAVGAVGDDTGGNRRGAVHVLFVKSDGFLLTDNGSGGSPNQKIAHQSAGGPSLQNIDQFGQSLANIGDVNGDGTPDLAVAADGDSLQGIYRGAAYILLMNPNGTVRSTNGITRIASGVGGGPTLNDRDYFGAAIANLGDIDGDGKTDIAISATNDDIGGTDRGAVHVLRLTSVPNTPNASPPTVKPNGATRIASGFNVADSSWFGAAAVNLGDLDGDGVEDLAVGAPLATISGGAANTGAVRILFMTRDGAVKSTTEIGGTLGLASFDGFGASIANIGDQDGDGVVDLAVGAPSDNTGGTDRGAVYLFRLNANGTLKGFDKLASGVSGMPSLANVANFGRSVASLGDIDADGRVELAIGSNLYSGAGTNRGAVYVLDFNPLGGGFGLNVNGFTRIASGENGGPSLPDNAYFGQSLANIGDIDGDGITDLAVGATGEDGIAGALYVLFMNRNGTARASTRIADLVGGGPDLTAADNFGTSVAALGDIDGDGVRDVAVGADFDDTNGTNRGAVHILRLATNGTVKSSTKLASGTGSLTALRDGGRFGSAIALFGDQNRDGIRDLVVGDRSDGTFGTLRGTAYILRLNVAPNLTPTGVNLTGRSIAENATIGTTVGTFSTNDPNPGDTFTYTLVAGTGSTDNASFTIVGNQLQSNAAFDFETKGSSAIRVRTTDQGGLSFEMIFIVTVTNVNENPTALNFSPATIAENLPIGTPIGTFSTVDPDVGDTFTYTLVPGAGSTDNASFTIVGNTLQSAAVFNFEVKSSYSILVETKDSGALGGSRVVIVNVTNVNEAPVLDNTGNVFTVMGAGARQSAEMRQGALVSDLLARGAGGNPISDPDAGALRGIALTAVDQSLGNFQYTLVTNNPAESDWINVDAAGAVSDASALLLPTTARIRFNTGRIPHHASAPPFLALESKLDAGLTFRAWDQTTGVAGGRGNASVNGGSTAFSTATETSKVYFEVRLFRHFNANASLNVYTLEAEFNALAAANNPAFEDRSTDAWTGFTVLLSNVPELATTALYRMYYGVQFNANGTQIDMGYRYLTTNLLEAQALENSGPAERRPQRAGAYFREEGVNSGTGILGYIYTIQQPGTQQMRQIYRTDIVQKPTRPPGTSEGGTPTSFTPQENGDHVYTTNTAFETTKTGTWRVEDPRGFVRPLGGSGLIAPATPAGATSTPVARAASVIDVSPTLGVILAGATGVTFTAILPPALATTSAVINPDNVSTTVDVGLIAPPVPVVQSPTPIDEPIGDLAELVPIFTGENNEESAATDELFASVGTTGDELCPW